MLHLLWTYRFSLYNLFMGLYFYFFSPEVAAAVLNVRAGGAVTWLSGLILVALLAEPLGVFLKAPAFRQAFRGWGMEEFTEALPKPLAFIWPFISLFFFLLGRLFLGLALVVIATYAYGVDVFDWEPFWAISMALSALLALGILIWVMWLLPEQAPKKEIDTSAPPSGYMLRDLAADGFLLFFNCIALSTIWIALAEEEGANLLAGILLFFIVYLPAGLPHFTLHTVHTRYESQREQLYYWATFLLTAILALRSGGFLNIF